jgi:translation initiation factor IF-1
MPKEDALLVEGKVTQALPNTEFRVKLSNGQCSWPTSPGKMRKNFIRIVPGDQVTIELSPYDLTKGRIVYRAR